MSFLKQLKSIFVEEECTPMLSFVEVKLIDKDELGRNQYLYIRPEDVISISTSSSDNGCRSLTTVRYKTHSDSPHNFSSVETDQEGYQLASLISRIENGE
jgi:hypothetical protein